MRRGLSMWGCGGEWLLGLLKLGESCVYSVCIEGMLRG